MKRFADIIISIILISLLWPLMLLITLSLLITEGQPVFFLQYRVGKNRQLFQIYKFRTMRLKAGTENGSFDAGNNKRVTPIGAVLRKTKLDELPQLFNVIMGQMSIVGPRPEVEMWTKVYSERWDIVLAIKPGITDTASLEFKNEETLLAQSADPEKTYREIILPKKLDSYETYVYSHSFLGDMKLLGKTAYSLIFK
ncbi:MAG: sugar transferase [Bacteroidales bacterium]|nr:sugar transferase [Bacteroidales bacterium]